MLAAMPKLPVHICHCQRLFESYLSDSAKGAKAFPDLKLY